MTDGTLGDIDLTAVKVLTAHQRLDIGNCICGWGVATGDLGRSHPLHVWHELQAAGVTRRDIEVQLGFDEWLDAQPTTEQWSAIRDAVDKTIERGEQS